MCNLCGTEDPRDELALADSALQGLYILVCQLPRGEQVPADRLSPLLGLIVAHMAPAVDRLQDYVPRDWTPPEA